MISFKKYLLISIKAILLLVLFAVAFYGFISVALAIDKHSDFLTSLPDISRIKEKSLPAATLVYDRNGNLIYEIYGDQRRYLASANEISSLTKNAFVAIEDRDFWHHKGFSIPAILRAAKSNVESQKIIQGGSTITQQLVKNLILGNQNSLERKIKEAILAFRLEQILSKDEIITFYLNQVSFGGNIYGVKTAAKVYFGKELSDLTVGENAVLAAILEAPSYYYPYGPHRQELLERKNLVLKKMLEQGYIKKIDYDYARDEPIHFQENKKVIKFPYFVMYVREELFRRYGRERVENGGLKVFTTIDPQKQKFAEESINKHIDYLLSHQAENAALVAADPQTGQILAMV